jgi:anti-sigma factor RsiW
MTRSQACVALLGQVSAYLDRELDDVTCRAIDHHCRECAACERLIAGLRETIGLCRATGERPLPAPVRARAQAQIDRLLAQSEESS